MSRRKQHIGFSTKKRKSKRLKKIGTITSAIIIGAAGIGFSTSFYKGFAKAKEEAQNQITEQMPTSKDTDQNMVKPEILGPGEEQIQYLGTSLKGKKYAFDAIEAANKLSQGDYNNNAEKVVFLTFDDGPSTTVTPKILEILDQEDVKGTFFVLGSSIEQGKNRAKELIKEEFDKGHAIANHSYSHNYSILYPSRNLNLNNFINDFNKTETLLKEILGQNFSTRVLRCPGGHSSWNNMTELDAYLKEQGKVSIDWNALNKDAEGAKKQAAALVENVKMTAAGKEFVVVLMHDTYGKEETAKALPEIIKYFKEQGYTFKTLA